MGIRYNTNDKNTAFNVDAFIAAHFDFNPDAASRAKLQYGISIE